MKIVGKRLQANCTWGVLGLGDEVLTDVMYEIAVVRKYEISVEEMSNEYICTLLEEFGFTTSETRDADDYGTIFKKIEPVNGWISNQQVHTSHKGEVPRSVTIFLADLDADGLARFKAFRKKYEEILQTVKA